MARRAPSKLQIIGVSSHVHRLRRWSHGLAQCNQETEEIKQNNGVLPASIKPATNNPNRPATCVGAPTYQLNGFGDPSLPPIYGPGSD